MRHARTLYAVVIAMMVGVLAACAGAGPGATPTGSTAELGRPQVVIESPPANAQVLVGLPVDVVTTAVDGVGVARIDLGVDGSTISSAEAPTGALNSFSAVHRWTPATPGVVQLSAVAYRTDGAPGDEFTVSVMVLPEGAAAAPYPTYGAELPPYRASSVPTAYSQPTYAANPTYAATPPSYAGATPTYVAGATPTHGADPTYTAAPTYTTAPTGSLAPIDGNLNFIVPFNGANELGDYISYPGGDVEDRVAYSVSGMSQTPPQNNAHVIVFATCEGTGTQYVIFKVGTQEFHCGDKIIDRAATFDSNTGAVRVFFATGASSAYVKWTLNGSAFAP